MVIFHSKLLVYQRLVPFNYDYMIYATITGTAAGSTQPGTPDINTRRVKVRKSAPTGIGKSACTNSHWLLCPRSYSQLLGTLNLTWMIHLRLIESTNLLFLRNRIGTPRSTGHNIVFPQETYHFFCVRYNFGVPHVQKHLYHTSAYIFYKCMNIYIIYIYIYRCALYRRDLPMISL